MTAEREGVAERWVLEPCPFCGHPPKVDEYNPYGGDSRWTAVACYAPECGEVAFRAPTEAEAIAAWNRRALRQGGEPVDKMELADYLYAELLRLAPREYGDCSRLQLDLRAIVSTMTPLYAAPPSPAKEG